MVGRPGSNDVGLPHVFTLRPTRVHRRAVFSLPSPTVSPVLLRAEGTWSLSLVARGSSCESPLAPCASVDLSWLGSLFRLWNPPRSVASVLCCLPGVRPDLLAVSEFIQDPNPVHAYALRCLILLTALRAFPVHPARCTHSCTDVKTSYGLPFPGPLSSSAICRMSVSRHWTSWFLPSSPTRVQLTVHMLSWCAW